MIENKKCSCCGGKSIYYGYIDNSSEIHVNRSDGKVYPYRVEPMVYICKECGHLDFFTPKQYLEDFRIVSETAEKNKLLKAEYLSELNDLEFEITSLDKNIVDCKAIVNDEEQTVKVVKEAKNNIAFYMREKVSLEKEIADIKEKLEKL